MKNNIISHDGTFSIFKGKNNIQKHTSELTI